MSANEMILEIEQDLSKAVARAVAKVRADTGLNVRSVAVTVETKPDESDPERVSGVFVEIAVAPTGRQCW